MSTTCKTILVKLVFVFSILHPCFAAQQVDENARFYTIQPEPGSQLATVVEKIEVVGHDENFADISVYYQYDGAQGPANIMVELVPMDGVTNPQLKISAGGIRKSHGKRTARIERPFLDAEEFTTGQIKVSITSRDNDVIAEKVVDKDLLWASREDDWSQTPLIYWSESAGNALMSGYYYWLDRAFDKWNDPAVRTADGKWRLDALSNTLYSYSSQGRWDEIHKKIKEWKINSPGKSGPAIVEAIYWIDYAWNARGSGAASSVSEIGWKLFRERLHKAEQILLDARAYASDNPLWYFMYLRVAIGLGWDKPDILKLFLEAVDREPHFYSNYFAAVNALSPKWGGAYELLDKVATVPLASLDERERQILYTRVYWSIDQTIVPDTDFFEDTLVDWNRMNAGFRLLLNQYPESNWNFNNYISFACRANDRDTYLSLRSKFGKYHFDSSAWKPGYSRDNCDHMFMQNS